MSVPQVLYQDFMSLQDGNLYKLVLWLYSFRIRYSLIIVTESIDITCVRCQTYVFNPTY